MTRRGRRHRSARRTGRSSCLASSRAGCTARSRPAARRCTVSWAGCRSTGMLKGWRRGRRWRCSGRRSGRSNPPSRVGCTDQMPSAGRRCTGSWEGCRYTPSCTSRRSGRRSCPVSSRTGCTGHRPSSERRCIGSWEGCLCTAGCTGRRSGRSNYPVSSRTGCTGHRPSAERRCTGSWEGCRCRFGREPAHCIAMIITVRLSAQNDIMAKSRK